MAPKRPHHALRLSRELWEAVEAARGDVPRNTFIVRALEAAIVRVDVRAVAAPERQAPDLPAGEAVRVAQEHERPSHKPRLPDRSEVQSPSLERFMPE